jgi:hypothetical protein
VPRPVAKDADDLLLGPREFDAERGAQAGAQSSGKAAILRKWLALIKKL